MELNATANLNEIYEGLTNSLSSFREQEVNPGCKRIIVTSGEVSITFDFIAKGSGLSATDIVTAKYVSGDWSKSVAINSLDQALEIVKVNLPNKIIEQASGKHM